MLLTCVWILLWLFSNAPAIALATPIFYALVFAVLVDLGFFGYNRGWFPWRRV